jgi:hypothetical protein
MPLKYAYDEILEMLGGYSYYTKEQVDYVFYEVNDIEPEKKQLCLQECQNQSNFIREKYSKLTLTNDDQNLIEDNVKELVGYDEYKDQNDETT